VQDASPPDDGLVTQLRALVIMDEVGSNNPLGRDAADRIAALTTDNAALGEVLAKIAVPHCCDNSDQAIAYVQRIARAALAQKGMKP
jgi:hypothetical protein